MRPARLARCIGFVLAIALSTCAFGATQHKTKRHPAKKSTSAHASTHGVHGHAAALHQTRLHGGPRWNPWKEPTFADSTSGDFIDGEDLTVRRAAVEALGPYNGTVVVVDPSNG